MKNSPIILTGNRCSGKTTISNLILSVLDPSEILSFWVGNISTEKISQPQIKLITIQGCDNLACIREVYKTIQFHNQNSQVVFETCTKISVKTKGFMVVECTWKNK